MAGRDLLGRYPEVRHRPEVLAERSPLLGSNSDIAALTLRTRRRPRSGWPSRSSGPSLAKRGSHHLPAVLAVEEELVAVVAGAMTWTVMVPAAQLLCENAGHGLDRAWWRHNTGSRPDRAPREALFAGKWDYD